MANKAKFGGQGGVKKQPKRKRPSGGGGGGGRKKGGGAGDLWDPNSILSGRRLKRASKKLTGLEIDPEVGGYQRLANELRAERQAVTSGIEGVGQRLSGQLAGNYRTLAESEAKNVARQAAIKTMLGQQSGQIAQQSEQSQTTAQQGALGSHLESLQARGAQGGGEAQQALADMVSAQRARMATSNAAAQQSAAAQGAGYEQYASAQASANQQRGAEAQGELGRTIAGSIGESNLRYGQDIRESLGKLAEAQAKRGPTRIKNLLDLRKSEREHILGGAAVKLDKAQLAETGRHNRASESTAAQNAATSAQQARLAIRKANDDLRHDRITEAQAQQRIRQARKRLKQSKKGKKGGGGGGSSSGLPGL